MERLNQLDFMKSIDSKGIVMETAEVLHESNAMIQDGPIFASNAQMGERVTIRNKLPTVHLGRLNQGIPRSKSSKKQETYTIGYIVGRSELDPREAVFVGDDGYNMMRLDEDMAFVESVGQKIGNLALYGDEELEPLGFTGIATILNATSTAISGPQVHSMGSVSGSDGTSIYIIDWGRRGAYWTRPMHAKTGGIKIENLGKQQVLDADNNQFTADVTEFHLMRGFAVKDPRRIARLANIDISDALLATPTQGLLIPRLTRILNSMPSPAGYKRVMYAHRDIITALENQGKANGAKTLSYDEWMGEKTVFVRGFPVRRMDQISGSEGAVS